MEKTDSLKISDVERVMIEAGGAVHFSVNQGWSITWMGPLQRVTVTQQQNGDFLNLLLDRAPESTEVQ